MKAQLEAKISENNHVCDEKSRLERELDQTVKELSERHDMIITLEARVECLEGEKCARNVKIAELKQALEANKDPAEWSGVTHGKNGSTTTEFKGPRNILSNMFNSSDFRLKHLGLTFLSSEQLFQWLKAVQNGDDDAADNIINESDPFKAKTLGDNVKTVPGWDPVKTLTKVARIKAAQCSDFRDQLLKDKNTMVEGTLDPFWGKGHDGRGKNTFGNILMQVRGELNGERAKEGDVPKVPENDSVLLIGNSQTKMIDPAIFSSRINLVKTEDVYSIGQAKSYVRQLESDHKAIIVYQVANELRGCTSENMCEEIGRIKHETEELVERIKAVKPEVKVYISLGVQSIAEQNSLKYQALQAVNATLKNIEGAGYIDNSNIGDQAILLVMVSTCQRQGQGC